MSGQRYQKSTNAPIYSLESDHLIYLTFNILWATKTARHKDSI